MTQVRQERQRAVVAAAAGLFAACGYRAASMEEIACRAGISKPVLYKSFSSKLELYLVVLHDALQVLNETLTAALAPAQEMRSIVVATVTALFDFADAHPRSAALLAGAAAVDEPSAQRVAQQAARMCADALGEALSRYPLPRAERGWLITAELVAIAQSCARDWVVTGKPLPKHEAIATTAALCWTGLSGVRLAAPEPRAKVPDTPQS
ncbi:TetR/AcrR family transcriptional regulator [Nocardia inohanensis]|uniref:TetR/AcrR family transcriptional regulator n=1 Tax=Nocardia inohanensis TaxID=209246 RepID=UPI000A055F0D|nr:TetR/AcrR family transcriptional regulator [Nocardia inohanensis]